MGEIVGKIIEKYYEGYKGENEIQIIKMKNGNVNLMLRIWTGFFDNIMYSIEPQDKEWKGLAYHYYLCDGWYESSPWKIEELNEVLNELKRINIVKLSEKEIYLLKDIANIIKEAIIEDEEVFIRYTRK